MDITALAASPVSESSPAGADAKYEPEYEAMTAEIAKLSSVSRSEPISWQAVADNAAEILAHKSKDIQAAAYMAVALQYTEGTQGLLDGARLLHGLFENFWDDAFPPKAKLRRRQNAYDWWHERTLELLKKDGQPPVSAELAEDARSAVLELDGLAGTLMEEARPLRDIAEAIRALPLLPEEKPEPAAPPAPAQPENREEPQTAPQREPEPPLATPAPQPPAAAPVPAQPGDTAAAQAAFVEAARAYASALRAEDPANHLAWQLPRVALWGRIAALPPADGSGQTMIPAPDMERIGAVERLLSGQNWLKAALAADDLFPSYPLYIDLQRMADEALGRLGPAFAAARARVRSETAALMERLPGLAKLSYDGGTPFAAPAARAWLDEITRGGDEAGPAGGVALDKTGTAVAEARELLAGGDAAGALKTLEDAHGSSAAANARLRAEELRILCSQRETKAAAALARALTRELEESGLARLEPELAVETMTAVCRALDLSGDAEGAERLRERIAAIKPSAVLGWS
ncbi:type VI secretion system protein TssA [Cloacibacillus sp. An23]|uniref:type VI secretion system protein TssA n=1 Tax=Cloacibacillus sp. An23 TaxID=1965591 RepID=UPI000B367E2E|nr:type VI secretion system protein TssA [Cloacibacillus sp. An23]OUO93850.1 type VI secretion system ImpA domain-containing protein [Cloacibacillus sp. An23]